MPSIFGITVSFPEHTVFVFGGLLVYAVITHVRNQERHSAAAIGWVLSIVLIPYLAVPAFLLFGTRKVVRGQRVAAPPGLTVADEVYPGWAAATLKGMGMPPLVTNDEVRFHADGGEALAALLGIIERAHRSVAISSYALGDDAVGAEVVERLVRKAKEGVQIRLLLDWIGSLGTARAHVRKLRAAGVDLRWFMPLIRNPLHGRTNLRNHRKLTIADDEWVWSGGRNLAAQYFIGKDGKPPWVDFSFHVHGPLAVQARALFDYNWLAATGRGAPQAPLIAAPVCTASGHFAQLIPSGPDEADDTIYTLLLTALYRAEWRVLAVTPYFVPDDGLLAALCMAARRGVRIELLVPDKSNHPLADLARHRALRELADNGAIVRLAPMMLHAKAIVVDGALALAGSANLDGRSLFLNFEVMTAFYSHDDIETVGRWVGQTCAGARHYEPRRPSLARDIAEGLVLWLAFQL
jgi:cardiolipin synthase